MRIGSFSGAGLGFGLAFSLVDDFSHNARRIERQMQMLIGKSGQLAAQTEAAMSRMRGGIMGLGLAMGMLFGWQRAIAADATFQNLELGFRSFLPTAKAASDFFKQIQQDAIDNPKFSIEGMAKANLMLVAQGVAAEKSRQSVKDLSMILLGVGRGEAELQRTAIALEKIETAKFMEGPQLRSLTTAGLPVVAMLKAIGVNLDPSHVKSAKISFEQLSKAFHNAVQPGQQFGRVAEMLVGNVSALGAQIRENFQVTLAGIGESIRPVTLYLLGVFSRLLSVIREFTNTPLGKFVFRVLFAFTLLLGVVSSLIIATNFFRWAMFRLAGLFGAVDKLVFLKALVRGQYAAAFRMIGARIIAMLPGVATLAARLGLIYLGFKLISSTTDGLLYALGVFLLFVMGPMGGVMAIFATISRSMTEFDKVLQGTAKPAQGLLGVFQRIGAVISFIGQAWNGFNEKTNEIEVSKSLIKAMDALGLGEWARGAATWIGRIRIAWGGVKEGFVEAYQIMKGAFKGIGGFLTPILNQVFGLNFGMAKNTDTLESWKEKGKMWGRILLSVLIGITGALLVQQGILLVNAAIAVWTFLSWAGPILLVIGLSMILGNALYRLVNYFSGIDESAQSSMGGVGDAVGGLASSLNTLGPQFGEVGKNLGKQLTTGIEDSMGDWWERFSAMDFSLWGNWGGDDNNEKYHYVPFSPSRSGYVPSTTVQNRQEFSQGATGRALGKAVSSNATGFAMNPLLGAIGASAQYNQGLIQAIAAGSGNRAKPQKIEVNLNVGAKTIAKIVTDSMAEQSSTLYPWQAGYQMPGADTGDQHAWTPPAFDD